MLELCHCYLSGVFEVCIFVKDLMNFVLDLSLQVKILQKLGNHFLNVLRFPLLLDNLILNGLLDLPENVRVFNVVKD